MGKGKGLLNVGGPNLLGVQ